MDEIDEETFANSISIPPQRDAFDSIREEFTTMLQNQLARGNNGLIKTKYLTLGIDADSIKAAKPRLERIETDGKLMSIFFGIYGSLASKNIHRNPKRFRAITLSIFLAVVLGLSLYSFSDFMLFQTSMDMKEDGSSYTDVQAAVPYKDLATAAKAISDEGISADTICVTQDDISAEFCVDVDENQLIIYFAGQVYLVLQK